MSDPPFAQWLSEIGGLIDGERDWACNCANVAALVGQEQPTGRYNWVGVYRRDPRNAEQLVLGPFWGQTACTRIRIGRGVCGTAAAEGGSVQRVDDVHAFPGHIACDSKSESELVVPVVVEGRGVVAVVDVDSPTRAQFTEADERFFRRVAEMLASGCDWE